MESAESNMQNAIYSVFHYKSIRNYKSSLRFKNIYTIQIHFALFEQFTLYEHCKSTLHLYLYTDQFYKQMAQPTRQTS